LVWFFLPYGVVLSLCNATLKLGIKKALLSSSLVSTFVGMLFWGLNLITYEEALVFWCNIITNDDMGVPYKIETFK